MKPRILALFLALVLLSASLLPAVPQAAAAENVERSPVEELTPPAEEVPLSAEEAPLPAEEPAQPAEAATRPARIGEGTAAEAAPRPVSDGSEPTDPGIYPTPNPAVVDVAQLWDFESDPEASGWIFVDRDGDGHNWIWKDNAEGYEPFNGTGLIGSLSWKDIELTPDNFAVSPAFSLNGLADANIVLYAKGLDPDFVDDVFAIYAGTSADPAEMTKISPDYTVTASWTPYTASLVDFAGEESVRIAIRHYNCTDMYMLEIDDVSLLTLEPQLDLITGVCGAEGDNLSWTLDPNSGTLTIEGSGAMTNYNSFGSGPAPWYPHRAMIRRVVIKPGLTHLGSSAFSDCQKITAISLPEGLISIDYHAFDRCLALTGLLIPASVTSIASSAFESDDSLMFITVHPDNPNYSSDARGVLFNREKTALLRAPGGMDGSYSIPETVNTIQSSAFFNCKKLDAITVPEPVQAIQKYTFSSCIELAEINLPDQLSSIGDYAFSSCFSLRTVSIPASVTSIGICPFNSCGKLTSIQVDPANPAYSSGSDGALYNKNQTQLVQAPCGITGAFEVPETVTVINGYAFDNTPHLTSVRIPGTVKTIGNSAFSSCNSLAAVQLEDGVQVIGTSAFSRCNSLTELVFPESVTKINSYALSWDSDLRFVEIRNPDCVIASYDRTLGPAETTELYGWPGSTAEAYAAQFGYTFYSLDSILRGVCGEDLTWRLNLNTGLLIIEGSGGMYDYTYSDPAPWYDYRQQITALSLSESLSYIGQQAFYNCSGLTEVVIPPLVTEISYNMFSGCTGLTNVVFPETLKKIQGYSFQNCASLTTLTIPKGVTHIGIQAFQGCTNLTGIVLPERLTSLDTGVFSGCISLSSVTVESTVCRIPGYANSLGNPASTVIYGYDDSTAEAFAEKHGYTFVSLGVKLYTGECGAQGNNLRWWMSTADWVLHVEGNGDMVELDSSGSAPWYPYHNYIAAAVLEEGVRSISFSAFWQCDAMTQISLPTSLIQIGTSAFSGCSALEALYIPAGVTQMWHILDNCYSLTAIHVSPENSSYSSDEYGVLFNKDKTTLYRYPSGRAGSYKIPQGVKTISHYAFAQSLSLTGVRIPDSVASIGVEAFDHCSSLKLVDIPQSVISIDRQAFGSCANPFTILIRNPHCTIRDSSAGTFGSPEKGTLIGYSGSTAESYAQQRGYTFIPLTEGCCGPCGAEGDNLFWVFSPEDGMLRIFGSGAMEDFASVTQVPWQQYRSDIRGVALSGGLTEIGSYAFSLCSALTEIELPDSVTSIGQSAFVYCSALCAVRLPAGLAELPNGCFGLCAALAEITLPEGLTAIGETAFYGCQSLTNIFLPYSVTRVGRSAFQSIPGLEFLSIENASCELEAPIVDATELLTIRGHASSTARSYALDNSIRFVPFEALSGVCGAEGDNLLWSFDLDTGVLTLTGSGDMMDYSAENPAPWVFLRHLMTDLSLPEGLTGVGSWAFSDSSELFWLTLPRAVVRIGESAFANCTALFCAELPEGLAVIGPHAFESCVELNDVNFPNGLTEIGESAFAACHSLWELKLPASLTELAPSVFMQCESLQSVTIPSSVSSIGESAFDSCISLTRLSLPASVTEIALDALANCEALRTVTVLNPECVIFAHPSTLGIPGQTTLYGCGDSTAQEYAEEYGYHFCSLDSFGDVNPTAYYAVPVAWAMENGITSGTGGGSFSPNMVCTREQVVTFLWNACGKPEPEAAQCAFTDVKPGKYYYQAVLWAAENGITGGISPTSFGVGRSCSREQVVTFLWNAFDKPQPNSSWCPFTDVSSSGYYRKPVLWAVEHGITGGVSPTLFGVGKGCTRAQVVTFLYAAFAQN